MSSLDLLKDDLGAIIEAIRRTSFLPANLAPLMGRGDKKLGVVACFDSRCYYLGTCKFLHDRLSIFTISSTSGRISLYSPASLSNVRSAKSQNDSFSALA